MKNKSGVIRWLVFMSEYNLMWILDPVIGWFKMYIATRLSCFWLGLIEWKSTLRPWRRYEWVDPVSLTAHLPFMLHMIWIVALTSFCQTVLTVSYNYNYCHYKYTFLPVTQVSVIYRASFFFFLIKAKMTTSHVLLLLRKCLSAAWYEPWVRPRTVTAVCQYKY